MRRAFSPTPTLERSPQTNSTCCPRLTKPRNDGRNIAGDLACHRGAPDKTPERRLAPWRPPENLPFRSHRASSSASAKPEQIDLPLSMPSLPHMNGTGMYKKSSFKISCRNRNRYAQRTGVSDRRISLDDCQLGLCCLRNSPSAPPNLSDDIGQLIDAGIDDWGGVSPVTSDHVNPERPWPELDRLRSITERGYSLAPRLTAHPEYVLDPEKWIDEGLRFAVLDRSDAEGLGRDDPGAIWPKRPAADVVHDGAEVVLIGHRSTTWYAGATNPNHVDSGSLVNRCRLPDTARLDAVTAEEQLTEDDIVTLFQLEAQRSTIAEVADQLRHEAVGDTVTWVHNRNINYTNVCTFKCRFCGFSKGQCHSTCAVPPTCSPSMTSPNEPAKPKTRSYRGHIARGSPDFDGDYYIDVTHAVRSAAPSIHVHGFTALEITEGAKRLEKTS